MLIQTIRHFDPNHGAGIFMIKSCDPKEHQGLAEFLAKTFQSKSYLLLPFGLAGSDEEYLLLIKRKTDMALFLLRHAEYLVAEI